MTTEAKDKKKATTFYIVLIALFSALVCVLTTFVQIPCPVGYINFGDSLIFIAASLLGPTGGMIVGAVGSSFADIFSGFVVYAPFTFVVKGGEGFLCGILYSFAFKKFRPIFRRLSSMVIAGAWMIVGYFFSDMIIYTVTTGSSAVAAANAVINFVSGPVQAGVSIVIALIVMPRIPTLFESVKQHTENDDEEAFDEQEAKKHEAKSIEANAAVVSGEVEKTEENNAVPEITEGDIQTEEAKDKDEQTYEEENKE